jgi:hypothetical protein
MLKIMRKYWRCVVHPIVTAYSGVDVEFGRLEIAIIMARHGKAHTRHKFLLLIHLT